MKKFTSLMLMLLAVVLGDQRIAQAGPLSILGVAGQYNVFVFGDLDLSQTDVEGRAAAGGNVTLDSFTIGSRVPDEQGIPSLVAGKNATLTNGSVGCPPPGIPTCSVLQQGTVIYGTATNQVNQFPPRPGTVGFGELKQIPGYIDFVAAQSYIQGLSNQWKGFTPVGTDADLSNNFDFTGTNPTLNVFNIQASAIITDADLGPSVIFHTPVGSTILVNITGNPATLNLRNMGFSFGGNPAFTPVIPGENEPGPGEDYSHNAGFPYSSIIFNVPDAQNIFLDEIALNGTLVAPLANIFFTKESHIDGNLIALSLSGFGESHAIPFVGDVTAVPAPATLLLLAGGLVGMAARRRRK